MKYILTGPRLYFIILHYANYYTDLAMIYIYIQNDYDYYLGITIITALISWLLCGILFLKGSKHYIKRTLLWILHLDYPFILCEVGSDQKKSERKLFSLIIQTIPAMIVNLDYFFYKETVDITSLFSMIFSIMDLAYLFTLTPVLDDQFYKVSIFKRHAIKTIRLGVIYNSIELGLILFSFGFLSALYRPWGGWIFIGVSLLGAFVILICRIKEKFTYWMMALAFVPVLIFNEDSIHFIFLKIIQLLGTIGLIVLKAITSGLGNSLFIEENDAWIYFIGAYGFLFVLWIVMNVQLDRDQYHNQLETSLRECLIQDDQLGGWRFELDI